MSPVIKKSSKEKKESAVSPVVGVMLMLVVTIIIAAVVAAFSSGVVTTTEKAPFAVLDASVDSTWSNAWVSGTGTVYISSKSGELINLDKVEVRVYNSTRAYASYSSSSGAWGSGDYLESGETVNLAYTNYKGLSNSVTLSSGDIVNVVIVYDDEHILLDKEVIAL